MTLTAEAHAVKTDAELAELIETRQQLAQEFAQVKDALDFVTEEIKQHMDAIGRDTLSAAGAMFSYKTVTSMRFETARFKKEHPELHAAYVKETVTRAFRELKSKETETVTPAPVAPSSPLAQDPWAQAAAATELNTPDWARAI